MPSYSATAGSAEGFGTVLLSSHAADLHAAFAPSLGMIGCSLRHRGAELLAQRRGLAQYAAAGSTMGIPLLHPWANRLSGFEYTAAGTRVALSSSAPRLHRDAHGHPMHGLLAAYPGWEVIACAADADGTRLVARLDFGADADLLAAFPFPHRLELAISLRAATLTLSSTLSPSGDVAVPISFGFHPYLQLPGVERAAWRIEAPVRRRARLDEFGIPTGATEPFSIQAGPLGARTFDDLFPGLDCPARFALAGGGRRITVVFEEGYPCAQIFAPPGEALICFEPMTAPTNALISGAGLRLVPPGSAFTARFSITVE
ncbi:MAG: aldose 1-epimerase [Candidatus Binatia bacterium]